MTPAAAYHTLYWESRQFRALVWATVFVTAAAVVQGGLNFASDGGVPPLPPSQAGSYTSSHPVVVPSPPAISSAPRQPQVTVKTYAPTPEAIVPVARPELDGIQVVPRSSTSPRPVPEPVVVVPNPPGMIRPRTDRPVVDVIEVAPGFKPRQGPDAVPLIIEPNPAGTIRPRANSALSPSGSTR